MADLERRRSISSPVADASRVVWRIILTALLFALMGTPLNILAAGVGTLSILDTTEGVPLSTRFSIFGTGGFTLSSDQAGGPEFALSEATVLTEIGGFVDVCSTPSFLTCGGALPLKVEVRPSVNGLPDAATILGTFFLSDDRDGTVISYESASIHMPLEPGRYFALFSAQGSDLGMLINSAELPFRWRPGVINLGYIYGGGIFAGLQRAGVRIEGHPPVRTVAVDVLPGRSPNRINFIGNGIISVAILTDASFAAADVDPASVRLGPSGATVEPAGGTRFEDVDGDGDIDLVLRFRARDTGVPCDAVSVSLEAFTFDQTSIIGSDSISTIGCN